MQILIAIGVAFLVLVGIPGCWTVSTFNAFQSRSQQVDKAWAKMLSKYQERNDVIGNLVETVKGVSKQESSVLIGVAEARTGAARATPPGPDATPEALAKWEEAQQKVREAMATATRITVESNPSLKSSANYMALQAKLSRIEKEATAARNGYIDQVAAWNLNVTSWPHKYVASYNSYKVKPQLKPENEAEITRTKAVKF